MSYLHVVWKDAGTATNVTSIQLGYSAGDYGIRRTDTDVCLTGSSAGTALDRVATGTYQHEFTPPDDDLTFQYHIKLVYEGRTHYIESTITGPVSANELELDYEDIHADVSDYLGQGRSPTGAALQKAYRHTQSGFRRFLLNDGTYNWTWLTGYTTITFDAGDTTADLPSDFGNMVYDPSFGASGNGVDLQGRSPENLQDRFAAGGSSTGTPSVYAIRAKAFDSSVGQRYEMMIHPAAGSTTSFHYGYRRNEAALQTKVVSRPELHEALRECCLAQAENFDNDNVPFPGPHQLIAWGAPGRYEDGLVYQAVRLDAKNQPKSVGYNLDDSVYPAPARSRISDVVYEGE